MSYDRCVQLILKHEGGYVNDPRDPGGETNYGISKKAYPDLNISKLSEEEAKGIYKEDYWDRIKGDDLPPSVALVVFDMAVNAGVRRSIKMLQEVVGTKRDGIIGDITLGEIRKKDDKELATRYTLRRLEYYTSLVNFNIYGKGWTKRTVETLKVSLNIP